MKIYPNYNRAIDQHLDYLCSVCHEPFTIREWAFRHSDEDGADCHERCCPICQADEEPDEIPTGDVMV